MSEFALTPPDGTTNRFQEFRAMIERFYGWKWNQPCPWDGSDAKQLSNFLKCTPTLDVRDFARWLYNYAQSGNITPGERPRKFLPRIHDYSVKAIDRFGKDPESEKNQSKQLARSTRNAETVASVFNGNHPEPNPPVRGPVPRGTNTGKGKVLEGFARTVASGRG